MTVTVNKVVTALTIGYAPVGILSGTLAYSGKRVVGPVTLWRVNSANNLVKMGTKNTHSDGSYSFTDTTPSTGTYQYYATYPGSSLYPSAQTHSISVTYS